MSYLWVIYKYFDAFMRDTLMQQIDTLMQRFIIIKLHKQKAVYTLPHLTLNV